MKIQSLLNPLGGDRHEYHSSASPTKTNMPRSSATYTSAPKRQKPSRDAPVFTEGSKFKGKINYLPHEAGDDLELVAQHRRFQLYPMGEIGKYCRHIPVQPHHPMLIPPSLSIHVQGPRR